MGKPLRLLLILGILIPYFAVSPHSAAACSCRVPAPDELFQASDAVFLGTVEAPSRLIDGRPLTGAVLIWAQPYMPDRFAYIYDRGIVRADVQVIKSWKGVVQRQEKILVRLRCTAELPAGEYLIYALKGNTGWRTSYCSLMSTAHYTPYFDAIEMEPTLQLSWIPVWGYSLVFFIGASLCGWFCLRYKRI